jgi:lysophospholipase
VLQAGRDEYADARAQDVFCANTRNCEKVVIAGAFHEILIERNEMRDVALSAIRSFIHQHCP